MNRKPQQYKIKENTVILDISTKKYPTATSLIDITDLDKVLEYGKWSVNNRGYAETRYKTKSYRLHRVIMNTTDPKQIIDHINNDRFDNRKSNLRICTHVQNHMNHQKTRGTSQYKGVSWDKFRNKWYVEIRLDGKKHYLGRFDDENEAGRKYNEAAKKLFGDYAFLNPIKE